MKSAIADVLFNTLGLDKTLLEVFFLTTGFEITFKAGLVATLGDGVFLNTAFAAGLGATNILLTGLLTGLLTVLATTLTVLFTTAERAGVTATAAAQMVTLPPFTCEPNLLDPDDPPEFLQLAKLGCGAYAKRPNMTAKPRMELSLTCFFMR